MKSLFYLLVPFFTLASSFAFAQTCTAAELAVNLTTSVTALDGDSYAAGSTVEICGRNTSGGNAIFVVGDATGNAISSVTIYRSNGSGFEPGQNLNPNSPAFLQATTSFSIIIELQSPAIDEDFTVRYFPNGGTDQTSSATVLGAPAPVALSSFTGTANQKSVSLNWATESESGNRGFEVQRSSDAINWSGLSFVDAASFGEQGADYAFQDEQPLPGLAYYRLKQMDIDEAFDFSPVISISVAVARPMVYPNPTRDLLNIVAPGEIASINVTVTTIAGRVVLEQTIGNGASVNVSALPAGLYQLITRTKKGTVTQRFSKQ